MAFTRSAPVSTPLPSPPPITSYRLAPPLSARGAGSTPRHHRASLLRESELLLVFLVHIVQTDAQVPARHSTALAELRQYLFRGVDGYGETNSLSLLAYRRIDPHHLALGVEQRPTRVTEVDGGIRLNVVVEARVEQHPPFVAHHTDGDGMIVEPEGGGDGAHPP